MIAAFKKFSYATSVVTLAVSLMPSIAQANPQLPLRATFTFTALIQPSQEISCPLMGLNIGSGTVSHLGKSAMVSTECVTAQNGVYMMSNGKMTVTAANGDTLIATYSGTFVPTGPTTLTMSGVTYSITGGSGRFANALGQGDLTGTQDLISGQGTFSVSGWIRY